MELRDYLHILRKNWLIILALTLVGIGAAAAYSLTRTPLYLSQSSVFVSTQAGSGSVSDLSQGANFSLDRVPSYVLVATSPVVLDPVIEELDLPMTASMLATQVSASAPLNSAVINVAVQDAEPQLAADIANATAASLGEAIEEIETTAELAASPVKTTVIRPALPTSTPVSPNVPLNLALGGLIGLALGGAVAILRTVLDTKVRNPRDIAQLTDRPMIGIIPFDPKAAERPIILEADPTNQRAESFRALRTNLQFIEMDGGTSFVITSSIPNEGKSTTAVNLAIALADAGKRVALIDTDLRKPKVADYLGIEGAVGLTDVLIGRAKVTDVMLPWGRRPLYVLPAGKVPPNPSELLGSSQMKALLDDFVNTFDVVICDAPPLLPVTDAAVLSRLTAGAIVVTAAGRTSTHQLDGALDALDTVGAKVAGLVMTMAPTKGPDSYMYGYGYGCGYGYGYGHSDKK